MTFKEFLERKRHIQNCIRQDYGTDIGCDVYKHTKKIDIYINNEMLKPEDSGWGWLGLYEVVNQVLWECYQDIGAWKRLANLKGNAPYQKRFSLGQANMHRLAADMVLELWLVVFNYINSQTDVKEV